MGKSTNSIIVDSISCNSIQDCPFLIFFLPLTHKKCRTEQEGIIHLRVSQITVREALNSALDEELERDDSVFVLGEEVNCTLKGNHCLTQAPAMDSGISNTLLKH